MCRSMLQDVLNQLKRRNVPCDIMSWDLAVDVSRSSDLPASDYMDALQEVLEGVKNPLLFLLGASEATPHEYVPVPQSSLWSAPSC